jgi:hypothetical protein
MGRKIACDRNEDVNCRTPASTIRHMKACIFAQNGACERSDQRLRRMTPLLCSAAGVRATTLARIELRCSPCSPLPRFLEGAPVALLWPSSRATPLPSEVRRLSLRTPGCLDPPAPASYLASHRELSEGRQRFWACISFGLPHAPLPDCRLTRDNIWIWHVSSRDQGGGGGGRGGRGGGGLGLGGCALDTDLRIALSTSRRIYHHRLAY